MYILEYSRCSLSGIWKGRLSVAWEKPRLCCDGRVFVKGSGEMCPKVHGSFSWKFSGSPVLAEVILLIDHLERICSCVSVTLHLIHSPQWDSIIIGNPPLAGWLTTVSLSCWCRILLDVWSQKRIASISVIQIHMYYVLELLKWSTLHVPAWRKCYHWSRWGLRALLKNPTLLDKTTFCKQNCQIWYFYQIVKLFTLLVFL